MNNVCCKWTDLILETEFFKEILGAQWSSQYTFKIIGIYVLDVESDQNGHHNIILFALTEV